MKSDTIAVRVFAWMATIAGLMFLFNIGKWMIQTHISPLVNSIIEYGTLFHLIDMIIFIGFILVILYISSFIYKWVIHLFEREKIAYMWSLVGCGLFAVFYAYIFFTPYFYTEDYLTERATERVYDMAALTDERIDRAKKTMTMGKTEQKSIEQSGLPLENIDIVSVDVITVERSFNRYTYKATIVQNNRDDIDEVVEWRLEIKPGFFTFLVDGYGQRY